MRQLKILINFSLISFLCVVVSIVITKEILEAKVEKKIKADYQQFERFESKRELTIKLFGYASLNWEREYKEDRESWEIFLDLVWSHRLLPNFLRLKPSSFDILKSRSDGKCNTWVKRLTLILDHFKIKSEQIDIHASEMSHSAIVVNFENDWKFFDPYKGYYLAKDDALLSLKKFTESIEDDKSEQSMVVPFEGSVVDFDFVSRLPTASFGRSSQKWLVNINIDQSKLPFTLGTLDNSSIDVSKSGTEEHLSSHLFYLGPRYSRNFSFLFNLSKPTKVVIFLTQKPEYNFLPKTNHAPELSENSITFRTTTETPYLILDYSKMSWSFERLLKLKNYYEVDKISFSNLS